MFKKKFVPQNGIYLLSHSIGLPLLNTRRQVTKGFFKSWEQGGQDIWTSWLQGVEEFRNRLGYFFNCKGEEFCPQTNLSSAVTKVIQSLPKRKGKTVILLCEDDFPSLGFALEKAKHAEMKLKFIPGKTNCLDLNVWQHYLTPEVDLALITHVQPGNGLQLPVKDITAIARHRDILTLVDIAQSAGVIPIDFQQWQADFIVGSSVKWLLGGPGAAYLWVHKERVNLCRPRDVGWFSHEDPYELDIHSFRYADGAIRFWGGTPSVLPFIIAANSLDFINSVGIGTIFIHNLQLSQKIIDCIDPGYLVSPASPVQRGGTLILNFGKRHNEIKNRLQRNKVYFDSQKHGIRVSPHLYNTEEQIDQLIKNCFS